VSRLTGTGEGLVDKPRGRPIPRVPVVVETARWAVLVRGDAPPELVAQSCARQRITLRLFPGMIGNHQVI